MAEFIVNRVSEAVDEKPALLQEFSGAQDWFARLKIPRIGIFKTATGRAARVDVRVHGRTACA